MRRTIDRNLIKCLGRLWKGCEGDICIKNDKNLY